MRFRAERPRKYLVWCLRNSYTFVALKLAWARREGGSVSPAILDRRSNEAPGQFQRNPKGGRSFVRRRCYSLLTDPLRICASLAPSLRPKSIAAKCIAISETPHQPHIAMASAVPS